MLGKIDDISARTFLKAQIVNFYREKWDKTMGAMTQITQPESKIELGIEKSQDIIYYRTKWPWPLKDRDYTLSRRCKEFKDRKAIVFISRSVDYPWPMNNGSVRVDKYKCKSIFYSNNIGKQTSCDLPGLFYVSMFCDDTKVALPAKVIDLLSRHAEKSFPDSMNKLFLFSKSLNI
jgi:hypothetical protein